jgi:hypothetical protein
MVGERMLSVSSLDLADDCSCSRSVLSLFTESRADSTLVEVSYQQAHLPAINSHPAESFPQGATVYGLFRAYLHRGSKEPTLALSSLSG